MCRERLEKSRVADKADRGGGAAERPAACESGRAGEHNIAAFGSASVVVSVGHAADPDRAPRSRGGPARFHDLCGNDRAHRPERFLRLAQRRPKDPVRRRNSSTAAGRRSPGSAIGPVASGPMLIAFLESTYRAATHLGGWDRDALECCGSSKREPHT